MNGINVPVIPPLLENNKLITDFKLKTNLLNGFFNQQCTTVDNKSSIPENTNFKTEKTLSTFEVYKVVGYKQVSQPWWNIYS